MRKMDPLASILAICFFSIAAVAASAGADFAVNYDGFRVADGSSYPVLNLGTWPTNSSATYVFTASDTAGSGSLTFTGSPRYVSVGLPYKVNAVDDLPSTLGYGSITTFTISLNTSGLAVGGTATAYVDIPYQDASGVSHTFQFALSVLITASAAADIQARRQSDGTIIPTGTTGAIAFGNQLVHTPSASQSVALENLGAATLTVTSISVDDTTDFSSPVPSPPYTVYVGSAPAVFSITFKPESAGPKTATISIASSDLAHSPYTFTVTGTATAPTMAVSQSGTAIPNGGNFSSGAVLVTEHKDMVFTVSNGGNGDLVLNGAPLVALSGSSQFSVFTPPGLSTIAPSGSTTFTIRFAPTGAGSASTTVSIANTDSLQNPYTFTINGAGLTKPTGTISPPTGLRLKGSFYFGPAPLSVTLTPTGVSSNAANLVWDLDGDGIYETPPSSTTGTKTIQLLVPELRTVSMKAISTDGFESDPSSVTIGAYPNDTASFPRSMGLPFDPEPPTIDGVLSGSDGKLDPSGSSAPPVDYGENGWRGAFSVPFGDGTDPHARVDVVRSGNFLYFAFFADFDSDFNSDDQIQVGIGKNADARFTNANAVGLITITAGTSPAIAFSARDADGNWVAAATPAGTEFAFKDETGSAHHWSAELKVPIAGTGLPWLDVDKQFLLFVRIIRAETVGPDTDFTRFTWPRTIPKHSTSATPESITAEQQSEWWGLASRDDSIPSNGLALSDYMSIGVKDLLHPTAPLGNVIVPSTTVTNHLVARVSNDAHTYVLDGGGAAVPQMLAADGVRVRFKIANWGVPSPDPKYWTEIAAPAISGDPLTANPTDWASVAAGSYAGGVISPTTQEYTLNWQLSGTQVSLYPPDETAENGLPKSHQCMLVEIETKQDTTTSSSTPANAVNVVSRSMYRNMNFDAANAVKGFVGNSEISGKGLESFIADLKTRTSTDRKILLRLFRRDWKTSRSTLADFEKKQELAARTGLSPSSSTPVPLKPKLADLQYLDEIRSYIATAPGTISFAEYVVKAYLFTGSSIQKGSRQLQEVVPIGSYGYVVRHLGNAEDWDFRIQGAEKINDTTYIIQVAKDGSVKVKDLVKAVEPPRWTFGLFGGAGFAAGTASPPMGTGGGGVMSAQFSLNRDELDREWALKALLGFEYLPGIGGASSWNAGNISAGMDVYLPFATWMRPYLSLQFGLFLSPSTTLQIGAGVGAGLDFAVSRPVHLQLGADFLGNTTQLLLRVNAGLVYRLMQD